MVRKTTISNSKISKGFAGIGEKLLPLDDKEYRVLEKKVKSVTDISKTLMFDDKSQILFGKIPDNFPPRVMEMADGRRLASLSFILPSEEWASMLIAEDSEEAEEYEKNPGLMCAIVGNLKIKTTKDTEKQFLNIRGYRGMIIFELGSDADDF